VDVAKDQYSLAKGERHPSRRLKGSLLSLLDFCSMFLIFARPSLIPEMLATVSMISSPPNLEGAVVRLQNLKTKASIVLSSQLRQVLAETGYTS